MVRQRFPPIKKFVGLKSKPKIELLCEPIQLPLLRLISISENQLDAGEEARVRKMRKDIKLSMRSN